MARKNLLSLTSAEKQQLVNLMLNYINDQIVDDHMHILHSGEQLFEGNREYVHKMENWLTQNGGGQFVPIPRWDTATAIPQEFSIVKQNDDGSKNPPLENLNPNMPLPETFRRPALCSFQNAAEVGNAINGWHSTVHTTIGGVMGDAMISPYAPIFWYYHAYLDDVYSEWQTCVNLGANRNFDFINFDMLSDSSKLPSGKVTKNLFKEWSAKNQPNLK